MSNPYSTDHMVESASKPQPYWFESWAALAIGGLSMAFGILVIAGNLLLLVSVDIPAQYRFTPATPWQVQMFVYGLRVVAIFAGAGLAFAGLRYLRRKWLAGLLLMVISVTIILANPSVNHYLLHQILGDGYIRHPDGTAEFYRN